MPLTIFNQNKSNLWNSWRFKILAGGLASFVLTLLATGLIFAFPQQVLTVDSGPVKGDVMVVLGGAWLERPQRAAELFKAGEAPLIICSGYGDAIYHKKVLVRSGVPVENIQLEAKSRTTQENAKFTITLLRLQHLTNAIIVTSWFHSRRALACFRHYGPDLQFYSRPSYASYSKTEWNHNGINGYINAEYMKLLGYWLLYGVCPVE